MKVNLATFSLHRYDAYAGHLAEAGVLNRFYYAHRLGTSGRRLGLAKEQAVNLFPVAYLAGAHARFGGGGDLEGCYDFYSALWQDGVLRRWRPADILQTVIGYRTERLMARAKSEGARILANSVTAYLGTLRQAEWSERRALGLDHGRPPPALDAHQEAQYRTADHFLVDSAFSRRTMTGAGISGDRVTVIAPGVDIAGFSPPAATERGDAAGRFRVIVPARLVAVKGHRYLLEAWRRLALPDAELLFAGGTTAETPAIVAGYEDRFRHLGQLSRDRLRDAFRSASVMVLPSLCDGWGQVVPEAMACGLPVIVTDTTGAADCIVSGQNGFIVPGRDPEALAETLEMLYRDEPLRRAVGAEARRTAERLGDWRCYAARLLDLYRTLSPLEPP